MPELHDPARAPTLSSVPSSVKPAPLTRAWCLLEIYQTAICAADFSVAVSRQNIAQFRQVLESDADLGHSD